MSQSNKFELLTVRQLNKKEAKKSKKGYKRDKEIFLILENIQYARNVATMFRTADAGGVRKIILTGISHKPPFGKDLQKASRSKERSLDWEYFEHSGDAMSKLKKQGFKFVAIELTDTAISLVDLNDAIKNFDKVCFVAGSEVYGITKKTLERCDLSVMIPMYGKGTSLNVGTSVGIVLFSF